MIHILFTCAGRRNYLINYFKTALQHNGKIFATDMTLTAPAMVDAHVAIKMPSIYDNNYISILKKIIQEHHITAVIPLNDLELPLLSKHKNEIEAIGTKVIVSSDHVIDITFDKVKTFNFLNSIGIQTPKTFSNLSQFKQALNSNDIHFPVIVKPRWGSASIGVDEAETLQELELVYQLQHIKLKKSILKTASSDDLTNAIIIQEKLNGVEYGMDVLNDFNGNYIDTFVRKKLSMRSGETDKAISVIDKNFNHIGNIISKHLKHIGNLDCDVFLVNNELFVLELNPRFGGGYPFSHEAGLNTPAIYIEWLKDSNNIDAFLKYKADVLTSKCDKLIDISNQNISKTEHFE